MYICKCSKLNTMYKFLNFVMLFFVSSLTLCYSQSYFSIEAETYDAVRPSGASVVIDNTARASNGQAVKGFNGNEFLDYNFNATAGTYTVVVSASNANKDTSNMRVIINGTNYDITITRTYDFQAFAGNIIENVTLNASNTLTLDQITSLSSNPDKIEFFPDDLVYSGGTWTPNAPSTTTGANNVMIKDGTYTTSGDDININSIIVSSGASVEISSTDILTINESIYNAGTFTFKSDSNGSGQSRSAQLHITTNTPKTTPANITIERFIPAKRAFRFLSSSVGGTSIADSWQLDTHITGTGGATNGFDATGTNNPSMFTFDNTMTDQSNQAAWNAVTSTADLLFAGRPYRLFVRGDRSTDLTDNNYPASDVTLTATGVMHVGREHIEFNRAVEDKLDYKFVGNPYQAIVDINAAERKNLGGLFYVWDVNLGTRGAYVTVRISDGAIIAPTPYSGDADQYVNPGQGFFVRNGNNINRHYIRFEESNKATGELENNVFMTYPNFYINSRLYKTADLQNGKMESDAIGLRFSEDYTTLGSDEDSGKMGNPGENYAIVNNGFRSLDYQGLPEDGHQIDLAIVNYQVSEYSLTFAMENKPENLEVFLNDNYLNTSTPLNDALTYNFTVDESIPATQDSSRFHLNFEQTTLNDESFTAADVRMSPNPVVNLLNIELPTSTAVESIKIYNMLGQEVKSTQATTLDLSVLSSGIYLVEVNTKQGQFTKKIIKL